MSRVRIRILVFQNLLLELVEAKARYLLYLFIAIYTVVFSYFTVVKHFAFQTYAGDLGIFEQSLWSTLKCGLFFYNTPELGTHFAYHLDPILYLLLPIYNIYPSPLTLLVLQSFFLSLGAVPIFWLARDELGSDRAGLVFATLYLLYPPLQGVNWYDFHPECLFPVLMIAAFHYFRKGKFVRYFVFIVLAMMCKEIISLIIVFMGIYGLWINRKKILALSILNVKQLLIDKGIISSILTIVAGTAWYILAGRIISSLKGVPYNPFNTWFYLGGNIQEIFLSFITKPLYVLQIAFTPFYSKIFYLLVLFGPLAFSSLLNLPSLLISLPWLAPSMLSLLPNHYQPVGFQYPVLLIPFIFISAIYGTKTAILMIENPRLQAFLKNSISGRIMKNQYIRGKDLQSISKPLEFILILLLLCSITFFLILSPIGTFPNVTLHDKALEMVVNIMPPYSSVATQNEIFPHLSHNLNAYPVYHPVFEYEYILVDKTSIYYYLPPIYGKYSSPVPPIAFSTIVPELIDNGTYGILVSIDGIMLLKKGYAGQPIINLTLL